MKSIKDFDVKYVLSPLDQESVLCGAAACRCTVYLNGGSLVAGTLYVDGIPMPIHWLQDGDIIEKSL